MQQWIGEGGLKRVVPQSRRRRTKVTGGGQGMNTARVVRSVLAPDAPSATDTWVIVARAREELDWDACLPARAAGLAWRVQRVLKRVFDLVLASVLLLLLAPVFALVALAVRLSSPGPVFYRWNALGERGLPFVTYKFRTMVEEADELKPLLEHLNEMRGPVFKIRQDPRITRLGRWLRKYSLDELPQLWSVIRGEMSLVGPRPPFPQEFARFEPWQRAKLAVRPGITCIWQVSGRSEISDFREWARLDLRYIDNWNLALDLVILLRTIPAVLSGRGAY